MSTLSFRDKGISVSARRHVIYFLVVFSAALVFFAVVLNIRPATKTSEISTGVMPIIYMESQGSRLSEMHGYLNEMDGCYMRESIVPLGKDRDVNIIISRGEGKVKSASYEIRSMDTERKIEEEALELTDNGNRELIAGVVLSNLIEEGEEYLLVITLSCADRQLRYYTRVMCPVNAHISECLDFASFFHETAISGDASQLEGYLETDPSADQDTLSLVTIHSTLSQVSWKGFEGEVIDDPVVRFTEIGDDYAAITYNYQRRGEDKRIYNIEEYFKTRYTADRMYLLDYERTMEEIPRDGFTVRFNRLEAGVCNVDFRCLSNDTGTVAAFVQAGELYEYNENTGEASRIFGFRDNNVSNPQTNYNQHGIRILEIDENGAIDFVVYGYMNAGIREGYSGISLFHYDAGEKVAREQAFIALTRPYPILEASFSELLYKNAGGAFYIMMDGTLTRIDSSTAMTRELLIGMRSDQYAVSLSGRYVAWMDQDNISDNIHVMDLENDTSFDITADNEEEMIRPLAFLEDNLAYGHVRKQDIGQDKSGNRIYPCYKVDIVEAGKVNGEVLKDYEKENYFVVSASSNAYTMSLDRVIRKGEIFEHTQGDTIQDSSGEPSRSVAVELVPDAYRGEITVLVLAPGSSLEEEMTADINDAALSFADDTVVTTLEVSEVHEKYYVYVGNRVVLASTSPTSAIKSADREMGIVVDNEQRNIWKRTKRSYVNPFANMTPGTSDKGYGSLAESLSAMLVREGENVEVHTLLEAGESPLSVLSGALKDYTCLDLSGCTLEEVLYFVSCNNPVLVLNGADEACLITGYDAASIYEYDPDSGKTSKIGRSQAAEDLEKSGNVFISYIH